MINLGEKQQLAVVKKVEFGVYLALSADEGEPRVLLPRKQVPEKCDVGDGMEVFIYRDSQDRLIATTREPKLAMGQVAELTVAQTSKIGAFLDWGLEKDLFLPFKQQRGKVEQGSKVLVSLYIDKSDRLCATMDVYDNLRTDSPYGKDDRVKGRVYEISDNFGAFVAVDNLYSGLIPQKELYGTVELGKDVEARVIQVREDGKLTLVLGFGRDSMKIEDITEVYGTHNPIAAGALSLDRVVIRGKRQEMMISVCDKERLFHELKLRNPAILIKNSH